MHNSLYLSMNLPCTLFETVSRFDDNSADDMRYGDMGQHDLLALGLNDISAKVDPWRFIRYDFPHPSYVDGMFGVSTPGRKISHDECVDILFNEMKELSHEFSFWGEYKSLIGELIDHFRYGNGSAFYSQQLNSAFHERINEYSLDSPLSIIKTSIKNNFDPNPNSEYHSPLLLDIKIKLFKSTLSKFNSREDRINGLGISIHDIAAQKITLFRLEKYAIGWEGTVDFKAQDHFGLDITDIKNKFYNKFRFFRIWFFLQHHKDFAFKPFFTNFDSVERINSYL